MNLDAKVKGQHDGKLFDREQVVGFYHFVLVFKQRKQRQGLTFQKHTLEQSLQH